MATIFGHNPNGELIDVFDGVTNGADVIIGNAGQDLIFGAGGNDVIEGGGGADYIDGGSGVDMATYQDSAVGVQVSLQSGKGYGGTAEGDTLVNIENLYGSTHDDILVGNSGKNTLYGDAGNDTLKGGGGYDTLFGGDGDDVLYSNGLGDKFDGGTGIDTAVLSESQYAEYVNLGTESITILSNSVPASYNSEIKNVENVIGTGHDDILYGDYKDNVLQGGDGADELYGADGNDTLVGGNGNDWLYGQAGSDQLTGGAGADTFAYTFLSDSTVVHNDIIMDFEAGVDKLDLSGLNIQQADLLMKNEVINGDNYTAVCADTNHNGIFDDGEFAVLVKMTGNAYVGAGDLIL